MFYIKRKMLKINFIWKERKLSWQHFNPTIFLWWSVDNNSKSSNAFDNRSWFVYIYVCILSMPADWEITLQILTK